jgi:hypothetical protein
MLSIKDSLIKYVFEPNKKVNTFWASSKAAAAQDGCSSTMVPIFLFLHLITNLHLIRSNNLHHSNPLLQMHSGIFWTFNCWSYWKTWFCEILSCMQCSTSLSPCITCWSWVGEMAGWRIRWVQGGRSYEQESGQYLSIYLLNRNCTYELSS